MQAHTKEFYNESDGYDNGIRMRHH